MTLTEFVRLHPGLLVLTGAGVSTDSGIPDYRDNQGRWKRAQPMVLQKFMSEHSARQRYWARSMLGWPAVAAAQPGAAHHALAQLQALGYVDSLVTQNVDGLHQAAGSRQVLDLHGRIDQVVCMDCGELTPRAVLQTRLQERNPAWLHFRAGTAPDGDADLAGRDFKQFEVPECLSCSGVLKPDVVFFGESVPKIRVQRVFERVAQAPALLVVGSSLMVFSGYRYARAAARQGIPVALLNLGRTRADELASLRIRQACGPALTTLVERLAYT